MPSTVTVNIVGDADSLKRALGEADSGLQRFADKARTVGDRATSIGRSMTFGLTLPLIGLGKVAFDELQESAAAAAQTEAAIRSTGGAANVTAKQVDELAASLLKKTGIDDEAIKSGENLLLTFKNIHNETGKGNDIFDRATKATLDLSVAFGKDMQSSAVLVGKALNDPIKGLTALTRVGVTFTDQQKEQIKALVASGDVMGAQKVILKELSSEVGGSAEAFGDTFAGQVSKAKEELKNAGAAILSSAVPAIRAVSGFAVDAAEAFSELPEPVKEGAVVLAALVAAAGPVTYVFGAVAKAVSGAISVFQTIASVSETVAIQLLYAKEGLTVWTGAVEAAELSTLGFAAAIAAPVAAAVGLGLVITKVFGIGSGGAFTEIIGAYDKATQKGKEWGQTIVAGAKASEAPLDELRARLDTLRTSQETLADKFKAGNLSEEEAAAAHGKYKAAIDVVKAAIDDTKQKQAELKAQNEQTKESIDNVANGTTNWADATEDAKNAILDLQSAVLAASGGELGLQQARLNQTQAEQALAAAIRDHGEGSQEATAAALNLEQARLGVASATLSLQDSEARLIDLVQQGPAAVQAEIDKLKLAQQTYGDTSGKIQEQIDKLVFLNGVINGTDGRAAKVTVTADTSQAIAAIAEVTNALDHAANRVVNTTINVIKKEFDG